ncbi:MAG: DUF1127 domain-containing protein [Paracoccaceae bacterium]|nr:DUF1127 domain-containing protein [Paracoccaceae bacterium]
MEAKMLERLKAMLDHHREHLEIAQMSERDLDDIGLTREQLLNVVDTPEEVSRRVLQMAARHGISEHELESYRQDFAILLDNCAHCHSVGKCGRMLADPTQTAEDATFCPNHEEYLALVPEKA